MKIAKIKYLLQNSAVRIQRSLFINATRQILNDYDFELITKMDQNNISSLSLQQLVEIYEGGDCLSFGISKQQLLLNILTHQQIKPSLKNQAHILKRIFSYQHVSVLINYIKQENPEDSSLLKTIKYDASGQNIPLCLKLPFMAMEILCCQCQIINEILFCGDGQSSAPLLPKLLSFLDHKPHYHLACYFSKVVCAITKRVSSTGHKYNSFLATQVFGENDEDAIETSCLFKSIKHFYSLSTFDFITRWLSMSIKQIQKLELDTQITEKTVINFKKPLKLRFLLKLVSIINNNQLDNQVRNNIPILFEQLLSKQSKQKKLPAALSLKSFGSINQSPKITLYDLAVEEILISQVLEVPKEGCLTLAKVHLIKIYLNRYNFELQFLNNRKNDDQQQIQTKLLQAINPTNLFYLYDWIMQHLKILLNMTKKQISSENSASLQNQPIEDSRVSLTSAQKMLVLQLCELVRLIQALQTCRVQIIEYYNQHSGVLANLMKRLMTIQNNLIHLQTNKIVLSVIKKEKQKNTYIPFDFARKLLFNTLMQLIDIGSIRMHVIEWASILLNLQNQHIFQDNEEQSQWEHIRQIVEEAKKIHIGQYALIQRNIDCFYSQEKAISKYSHFLLDFKPILIYEDKKEGKANIVQNKGEAIEENATIQTEAKAEMLEDGQSQQAESFFTLTKNYLQYDVNKLIQQL